MTRIPLVDKDYPHGCFAYLACCVEMKMAVTVMLENGDWK